jgi:hypothetical protein
MRVGVGGTVGVVVGWGGSGVDVLSGRKGVLVGMPVGAGATGDGCEGGNRLQPVNKPRMIRSDKWL